MNDQRYLWINKFQSDTRMRTKMFHGRTLLSCVEDFGSMKDGMQLDDMITNEGVHWGYDL
jgi:hypothetical protein